jgi:hypothetical protein
VGIFNRPTLDGGRDAPLDEHGLRVWHLIIAGVVAAGIVLVVIASLA